MLITLRLSCKACIYRFIQAEQEEHLLIFSAPASTARVVMDKVPNNFRELSLWHKALKCHLISNAAIPLQRQLKSCKHTACPSWLNRSLTTRRISSTGTGSCLFSGKGTIFHKSPQIWRSSGGIYRKQITGNAACPNANSTSLLTSHARSFTCSKSPSWICLWLLQITCLHHIKTKLQRVPLPPLFYTEKYTLCYTSVWNSFLARGTAPHSRSSGIWPEKCTAASYYSHTVPRPTELW